MGCLASNSVKSRRRLPDAEDLKFIYKPNAIVRRDRDWLDYVNLSVSRINAEFFGHSCRWARGEDLWWCILSFEPSILAHEGVFFTTTNNIYPSCKRGIGAKGLQAMFASIAHGKYSIEIRRDESLPQCWTTCEQAEVLYPGELSLDHLQRIYVANGCDQDDVYGQLAAIGWREVEVQIAPERFFGNTGY